MYFDGSLMATGAGAGVVLICPVGDRLRYAIRLLFATSNNVVEYKALIHGLRITSDWEAVGVLPPHPPRDTFEVVSL
jgi:ribonuclease HI